MKNLILKCGSVFSILFFLVSGIPLHIPLAEATPVHIARRVMRARMAKKTAKKIKDKKASKTAEEAATEAPAENVTAE